MDTDRIAGHPANAGVVRFVGPGVRAAPDERCAIDGYELHAHPDLEERLRRLASGIPGASVTGLRGCPVVVDEADVMRALAIGTSGLMLRLADERVVGDVLAHRGAQAPELGTGWVRADPWLPDVPSADGTALLRGWLATAFGATGGAVR